jgi:hypothetical protein
MMRKISPNLNLKRKIKNKGVRSYTSRDVACNVPTPTICNVPGKLVLFRKIL